MDGQGRVDIPVAPRHTSGVPAARLGDILDIAEDGIVTVNAKQEIVLFNRGAVKLFGFRPDEVLGRHLEMLIPPQFHAIHHRHMGDFARSAAISRLMAERREVHGRRKDGTEFPAEISISKIEGNGEPLFTAIVRDATERKRYEKEILQLNQELEDRVTARTAELAERNLQLAQKNEENEMFVYSVSHDLRSPLVNLEGFSEELALVARDLGKLLNDEKIPNTVRQQAAAMLEGGVAESISFIRAAVSRLSGIIDALLRLSRVGRVVYQPQLLDVAAIVQRVVDSARHTAEAKKATVTVGELSPTWGDPAAVEQIFANLIGNALNYLDSSRPGRIEIGSRNEGPKGCVYYVKDNGVGIPQAYLPKLFQVFQRLHPDKSIRGEGIGLAIVRRVLERLGGRIWVESEEGKGSTFFFTLPTAPAGTVFDSR
ncbi:MAG: PAS domain S-box protein [Planctomycetes bacterium]|nr:PAS domain S-box protein [Planctomycetota bacterium]